jgi:hypothetical protein
MFDSDAGLGNVTIFADSEDKNVIGKCPSTDNGFVQKGERIFIDEDADGDSTVTGTAFGVCDHRILGGLNSIRLQAHFRRMGESHDRLSAIFARKSINSEKDRMGVNEERNWRRSMMIHGSDGEERMDIHFAWLRQAVISGYGDPSLTIEGIDYSG